MAKKSADCSTTCTALDERITVLAPSIQSFNLIPETQPSPHVHLNLEVPQTPPTVPPCQDAPQNAVSKALIVSQASEKVILLIPNGEEGSNIDPQQVLAQLQACEVCAQLKRDLRDSECRQKENKIEMKKLETAEQEKCYYITTRYALIYRGPLNELLARYEEVMELVSRIPSTTQPSKEEMAGEIVDAIAKMERGRSRSLGSRSWRQGTGGDFLGRNEGTEGNKETKNRR